MLHFVSEDGVHSTGKSDTNKYEEKKTLQSPGPMGLCTRTSNTGKTYQYSKSTDVISTGSVRHGRVSRISSKIVYILKLTLVFLKKKKKMTTDILEAKNSSYESG